MRQGLGVDVKVMGTVSLLRLRPEIPFPMTIQQRILKKSGDIGVTLRKFFMIWVPQTQSNDNRFISRTQTALTKKSKIYASFTPFNSMP
jgi:hypothetical protein